MNNSKVCNRIKVEARVVMKKAVLTFLWLLSGILAVQAQGNFKLGYIITKENDTINGWIDFRTDAQNMSVCKFKTDETGKAITYLPGEIYGYRFDLEGKFYVSREITINDTQRTVFLEYLLQGIMNLYYYIDILTSGQEMAYYFFENEAGIMTPVTKKPDQYITDDTRRGHTLKHEDFRYTGLIKALFTDQEPISKKADKLKFNPQAMIQVAKEYHALVCTTGEECIVFETKEDKAYYQLKYAVYGGVHLLSEEYPGTIIAPAIGVGLNVSIPRFSKQLSFQADLSFSNIHKTADYDTSNSPYYYIWVDTIRVTIYESYLSYTELTNIFIPLQIGLKYSLGNGKIRPTIGGGFRLAASFGKKYKYKYNITPLINSEYNSVIMEMGVFGSLGIEYILNNKHSIFLSAGHVVYAPTSSSQFILGFTF